MIRTQIGTKILCVHDFIAKQLHTVSVICLGCSRYKLLLGLPLESTWLAAVVSILMAPAVRRTAQYSLSPSSWLATYTRPFGTGSAPGTKGRPPLGCDSYCLLAWQGVFDISRESHAACTCRTFRPLVCTMCRPSVWKSHKVLGLNRGEVGPLLGRIIMIQITKWSSHLDRLIRFCYIIYLPVSAGEKASPRTLPVPLPTFIRRKWCIWT